MSHVCSIGAYRPCGTPGCTLPDRHAASSSLLSPSLHSTPLHSSPLPSSPLLCSALLCSLLHFTARLSPPLTGMRGHTAPSYNVRSASATRLLSSRLSATGRAPAQPRRAPGSVGHPNVLVTGARWRCVHHACAIRVCVCYACVIHAPSVRHPCAIHAPSAPDPCASVRHPCAIRAPSVRHPCASAPDPCASAPDPCASVCRACRHACAVRVPSVCHTCAMRV